MLNKNDELFDFIKGKKVALIGPAPTLINSSMGEFIDSFELVCRMKSPAIPEDLQKDYGKRCDILFHNCDPHEVFVNLLDELDKYTPQFVCLPVSDVTTQWNREPGIKLIKEYPTTFYHVGNDFYKEIIKRYDFPAPNTLIATVEFLFEAGARSIFIGGFSFYKTKEMFYKKFHFEEMKSNYLQNAQVKYFKKQCRKNNHDILLDEYLGYDVLGIKQQISNRKILDEWMKSICPIS